VDGFDTYIFDMDGVIWVGAEAVPGAAATITRLQERGKRVLFLTNNSTRTRQEYVTKLSKFGIKCSKSDIYSSAYAAAAYIESQSFSGTVYLIGEDGVAQEIEDAGIGIVRAKDLFGQKHILPSEMEKMDIPSGINGVVVGQDFEFTWTKLAFATFILHRDHSCLFVSTNQDQTFPSSRTLPGTGAVVAAVKTAAMRDPVNVGKPSTFLIDYIIKHYDIERSKTLMIGDRLNTDIAFGKDSGLGTCLVLTGVSSLDDVRDPTNKTIPDFYLSSAGSMFDE